MKPIQFLLASCFCGLIMSAVAGIVTPAFAQQSPFGSAPVAGPGISSRLNLLPVDTDGDGIPNDQDWDIDGDSLPNGFDYDIDGDGIMNESDLDIDGDGIPNYGDAEMDGDFELNIVDTDMDGDGIKNSEDSTPKGPVFVERVPLSADEPIGAVPVGSVGGLLHGYAGSSLAADPEHADLGEDAASCGYPARPAAFCKPAGRTTGPASPRFPSGGGNPHNGRNLGRDRIHDANEPNDAPGGTEPTGGVVIN